MSILIPNCGTGSPHFGILFRWGSLWVGGHWSPENQRLCINLIPCVTFWFTRSGGVIPRQGKSLFVVPLT